MNCVNCGAPLPLHTDRCEHCNSVNDIDMGRLQTTHVDWGRESDWPCPRCGKKLKGVNVSVGEHMVQLDRCGECLGIFFSPPHELDLMLDSAVPGMSDVDYEKLRQFVEQSLEEKFPVRYIPCPVCNNFMNRKGYGRCAGVVMDWCKDHGYWLDGGEFGKLLRWARSGGREADRRR